MTLRAILLCITVLVLLLRLLLARQKRRAQADLAARAVRGLDARDEARARGFRARAAFQPTRDDAAPSPALDDRGDRADHPPEH